MRQSPYTALPSAFHCVRKYGKIVGKVLGVAQLCLKSLSLGSGLLKTYTERDSQPCIVNREEDRLEATSLASSTSPVHCTLWATQVRPHNSYPKCGSWGFHCSPGGQGQSGPNLQLLKQPNVPLVLSMGKPQLPIYVARELQAQGSHLKGTDYHMVKSSGTEN